ncbi:unnamed protein product [Cylicocyclus nassatus]|uniref:Uncharacterized protein n=1 Tax=Cylicocyclus nassatus TaxID=53992 RepID=A0AA36H425_CYLNA|nr:unnamed protein product [Cylicocyclus nassatus]
MLTYASIALFLYTVCSCLIVGTAFLVFGEEKPLYQLTYAFWNVYQALSFAAVVWFSLAATGGLQRLLQCSLGYVCCRNQRATTQTISVTVQDRHCTTERYFSQLESAWRRHAKL